MQGFIDYEQHLTDDWLELDKVDIPPLPPGLESFAPQVAALVDSLHLHIPLPDDGRKPKRIPLNQANFEKKAFQELWDRINHKAVYQVEFDSAELVAKGIDALDQQLHVTPLQYVVQAGEQNVALEADDLSKGEAFTVSETTTHTETATASSQVKYDLLGEIHREDPADPSHSKQYPAGRATGQLLRSTDRIPSSSSPTRRGSSTSRRPR